MKLVSIPILALIFISLVTPLVIAQEEDEDIAVFGLELEKLLYLVIGILAVILFIIAFMAYRRDGRKRLLYVSIAFLLFAIKGFLVGSEIFIEEIPFIDPIVVIIEFAIILIFFFGVFKK